MKAIKFYILVLVVLFIASCKEEKSHAALIHNKESIPLKTQEDSFQVLKLTGTNYEMGMQHGSVLKKEIHDLVKRWEEDLELNYHMPADEFITKFLASTQYVEAIKQWTPNLFEEIKGISDGSGIGLNKMIVFQLIDEMWNNGGVVSEPHHCSSLGVANRDFNDKVNYIAQNIDVTPFYHKNKIVLTFENPLNKVATYIVTIPGVIGANGLNSFIGVTVNSLMDLQHSSDGLPVCCVVRGTLEKESFEEAANFINTIKHASGQNYIVGSKSEISSFECSAAKVSVFWPDSTRNCTFHANNALENDSYRPKYIQFLADSLQLTHDEFIKDVPRLESLKKRMLNKKSIDLNTIKETLRSKDSEKDPICNQYTWVSTIMEFHEYHNVLLISPGKPDSTEYVEFRIE